MQNLRIINTRLDDAAGVSETVRAAFRVPPEEACDDCMTAADVRAQIKRFPAGQFAAIIADETAGGTVVGMAATMRTSRPAESISPALAGGDWRSGHPRA